MKKLKTIALTSFLLVSVCFIPNTTFAFDTYEEAQYYYSTLADAIARADAAFQQAICDMAAGNIEDTNTRIEEIEDELVNMYYRCYMMGMTFEECQELETWQILATELEALEDVVLPFWIVKHYECFGYVP